MNQVVSAVLIILLPLLAGFLIPCYTLAARRILERLLSLILYAILLLIGMNIIHMEHLDKEWPRILLYGFSFLFLTLVANIAVAYLFDRRKKSRMVHLVKGQHLSSKQRLKALYFSGRQLFFIAAGMGVGWLFPGFLSLTSGLMLVLLILMLFIVGLLLRNNAISLRQLFLNPEALYLAIFFTLSCWAVALLVATIYSIPANQALALNSGFGWYSLTVGYFQETYGPFWSAVTVINDLGREIMAFILIPLIMQFSPSSGLTVAGSTSMDFTLPAIQESGGFAMVPEAISFGIITSLICPVAIAFFSHI